jgi:phosphoglycerate dehydrogenase-like enzyme
MKIAFAGSFAVRLADAVRARLSIPCEMVVDDEARILSRLAEADVIVSMGFTKEMAEASHRLRLIQVPGAGLDRIDRSALRPGMRLANAYGHEAGIAEYVIGAMIALTRPFRRIDSKLRQGQWDSQQAGIGSGPWS